MSINTQNDTTIMALKAKIEEKKLALKKIGNQKSVTNCVLTYEGKTYNLNVLSVTELTSLLINLNTVRLSINDLSLNLDDYPISGYTITQWMEDIKGKIGNKSKSAKKRELDKMELQLDELLSEDKKKDLKLQELAELLK